MFHGLAVQAAADPDAFDHRAMVDLCVDMVGSYLWSKPSANGTPHGSAPHDGRKTRNGAAASTRRRRAARS